MLVNRIAIDLIIGNVVKDSSTQSGIVDGVAGTRTLLPPRLNSSHPVVVSEESGRPTYKLAIVTFDL